MKICYLGNSISIHNQRWSSLLAKRGHEVHFITLNPPIKIPGVKMHSLFTPMRRYLEVAFILKKNEIRKLVEGISPDVLHGHYLTDYGFYASTLNYHPLVISTWGSDVLVHPKESIIFKWRVKTACKKADAVTAENELMAVELHKNFNVPVKKIETFPWGVDTDVFNKGYEKKVKEAREKFKLKESAKIVFSPRSIKPIYSIDTIVNAIPAVLKECPGTVFIFARGYANADYESRIKERTTALKTGKNAVFLDAYLSDDDMAVWYNLADIFVSASQSDTISLSVLEGMACGSIPVVSDIKGNQELVTDNKNGFVFALDNKDSLAEKIATALRSGLPVKNEFRKINREMIENKYSIKSSIDKLEKVYIKVAKK